MKKWLATTSLLAIAAVGCVNSNPAPGPIATQIPPEQATQNYWMDKPALEQVNASDFFSLWNTAEQTLRERKFRLDRLDQRSGLMTTEPLVSRQWFEVWRTDVVKTDDLTRSSLATIRRTVQIEITSDGNGKFTARPRVLIEQMTEQERQITYAGDFTQPISGQRVEGRVLRDQQGKEIAGDYWYAIGRDTALEKSIVDEIEKRLSQISSIK